MLASWTKVLPFFIVEWVARRKCERFDIDWAGKFTVVSPYKDTIITLSERK